MAGAKSIRAGEAYIELATRNNKLVKGLGSASKSLKSWGASATMAGLKMAAAGLAAAGPLLAANKAFVEAGSKLADMAQRTGVSVERLSELAHAAGMSGTDIETVEKAVAKMQKTLGNDLSKGTVESLAKLGINAKELQKQDPATQFATIARAVGQIQDPTAKAAAAVEFFGKSGAQLIPMLGDMDALTRQARELGLVMSTKDAQAAAALGDALDTLWATVSAGVFKIGAALEPAITSILGPIQAVATKSLFWIEANRDLFAWCLKISVAVVAAGAAVVLFGTALSATGYILAGIVTLFGIIGTGLSFILSVVGFLLSPLGLVVALVAGLAAYFIFASDAGQEAVEGLALIFGDLAGQAQEAFGAIGKALAGGEIGLAVKFPWATLKMYWAQGINALQGYWTGFVNTLLDLWTDLKTQLAQLTAGMWGGLNKAFSSGVEAYVKTVWSLLDVYYKALAMLGQDTTAEQMAIPFLKTAAGVTGQTERGKIDKDTAGTVATLGQMGQEEKDKRDRAAAKELEDGAAELAAAAGDWRVAVDAANATPTLASRTGPKAKQIPELEEIDLAANKIKTTAAGTFSAQAAGQLGTESIQERTARATEATAKNTKKMQDALALGFSFA